MKQAVEAWLRAGALTDGAYTPTEAGTPQGGVISPLLANIALHGMEEAVQQAYTRKEGIPQFVRYADDVRHLTHYSIPLGKRRSSEEMTSGSLGLLGGESQRGN
jgi:retron-type reverse transcriptase